MKDVRAKTRKFQREINLVEFLNEMKTGEIVSIDAPETPPWLQEGFVCEITEVTYGYLAETSFLRWTVADAFAASERGQPLQLFWMSESQFFGRQLTAEESFRFCQLTGTKFYT